jgi:UPF0755 protein
MWGEVRLSRSKRPKRAWDQRSLYEERRYGFFWYDWLWRLIRPAAILLCALLLLTGVFVSGGQMLYRRYLLPMNSDDQAPMSFVVESGSSLTRVAQDLEDQGLIRNHSVLKYLMDFRGMSQKVQAGAYSLSKAMSLGEIIEQLTQGDGKPLTRNITVIPGRTIENIAESFAADGVIADKEAFLAACRAGTDFADYYYISDVLASPRVSQRMYVLEGYLAPDTYEIYSNASINDILKKLLSQTETVYSQPLRERAEEIGMTMDQVLTLASIIEKEGKDYDFAKVSAVFHNRLDLGMTLGSDPTVTYSTGIEKMALSNEEVSVISSYNTYTNTGLPVGPICNPSRGAIEAALYPDETFIKDEYLYFCSTVPGSGVLAFSKTLSEHNEVVEQYRPLWIEYDKSNGAQ